VRIQIPKNWFYAQEPAQMPGGSHRFAYRRIPSRAPRPGNLEDELVNDFLALTNQPEWVGDDVEGLLRTALRRAADAAVRTTLDAEKPAGVVYQTAEERATKKPQRSLDLNDILVAINKFSFHLVQFSAKVALYSLQQDLKDAASVLEDAANDLQDAIGESLYPEQEVAQP